MKLSRNQVSNLLFTPSFLRVIKNHQVCIDLLPAKKARKYYNMSKKEFKEAIVSGKVHAFNLEGVSMVPLLIVGSYLNEGCDSEEYDCEYNFEELQQSTSS